MNQKNLQHVAIIMDGNGRWALQRGLPRVEGHRRGVQAAKNIIEACLRHQISILSLFAFGRENWARPQNEVNFLMELFLNALSTELVGLMQHGVRVQFLGQREELNEALTEKMQEAEMKTQHNSQLILNIAMNYSGQWDIVNAVQRWQQDHPGVVIDEQAFSAYLSTANLANPDLFIRTSGEQRISNFFLWQIAYTELYFTEVLWPDFDSEHFEQALAFYQTRERRFGKISNQLQG